jgi:hypothetical protein
MKPAFLITIDTEGDNLWSAPSVITTENSRWLPRFQAVCDDFGLKPTYVTNYEMALCPVFREFARAAIRDHRAEVGAHLHAWNSPPLAPLTANDNACGPYATEYPPELLFEKVRVLTRLLEDTFGRKMISHRAGRWGFDGIYARALVENGYLADCSVTPGVSWRSSKGDPHGAGGPDYTGYPQDPYFLDLNDISKPGASSLLEVPVTIGPVSPAPVDRVRERLPKRAPLRRALNRLWPPLTWLRPDGSNLPQMLRLVRKTAGEGRAVIEFMLHSSELMPGGSPTFPDAPSIERLYGDLRVLFGEAARLTAPSTLGEFAAGFKP